MTGKAVDPSEHSNKDIRKELDYWVSMGWIFRKEGHGFRLYCPCEGKCTTIPVGGTVPRPERRVRGIRTAAQLCPKDPEDPRRSLTGLGRGE